MIFVFLSVNARGVKLDYKVRKYAFNWQRVGENPELDYKARKYAFNWQGQKLDYKARKYAFNWQGQNPLR
jgi:hypothetical protein